MGEQTKIQWTDHTFNPWWGCFKVSPACDHCYAEAWAKRTGQDVWGVDAPRRFFGMKHWAEPVKWNNAAAKEGRRHRVFCASMADVFEDRADLDAARAQLWALICATPWLDWQLLTKRPQAIGKLAPVEIIRRVWLGVTAENDKFLQLRGEQLVQYDARVLFFSCEPLFSDLNIAPLLKHKTDRLWVIAGGESGGKAREFQINHGRSLRDQCASAGVPFLMKQLGKVAFDGKTRLNLVDQHGGDWSEWPADLRVRQFPQLGAA